MSIDAIEAGTGLTLENQINVLNAKWYVERHDDDDGTIAYEIWCLKPYWRVTTLYEWDNSHAHVFAEHIASAHNAALTSAECKP